MKRCASEESKISTLFDRDRSDWQDPQLSDSILQLKRARHWVDLVGDIRNQRSRVLTTLMALRVQRPVPGVSQSAGPGIVGHKNRILRLFGEVGGSEGDPITRHRH